MNIKLKDVIHLYLGCPVKHSSFKTPLELKTVGVGGITLGGFSDDTHYGASLDKIQLILRPLSDMTGNEVLTAFHLSYDETNYQFDEFQNVDNNEFGWRARNQNGMECFVPKNSFKPAVFTYLLSIGIDLFELIESNQAIDKTKL